ncbi:MAG: UDP-N-acetylmuramoyl-L-alanine--D-glutamate ligase [Patescibacteria group bacterium]
MLNYRELFEGKKITVLGLGLLGRGMGDAEFLAKCGADVLVTDKKSEKELAESVKKLKQYKNVSFKLGGHDERDFINSDLVIKGAKTPLDSPYIAAAKKAGVPVVMSTALFAKYAMQDGVVIVGVTGTRGKSTITHMIHHCLISAFAKASADKRTVSVFLGGNVRGVSTLAMLPDVQKGDIAVLELDSWQLQGFGDIKISPHVSIFTNLFPDHQDYYPNMESYFEDKANIFRYQSRRPWVGTPTVASGKKGALFVGESILQKVQGAQPPIRAIVPPEIPTDWKLKIIGVHNRQNAALAVAALRSLGLSEPDIQSGIESFSGLEGRLQFVGKVKGVSVYNDTSATTPEATIAALRAVGDEKKRRVVLILGGDEKNLPMSELLAEIPKWCSKVVLFKERGTERIRDEIFGLSSAGVDVYEEKGLSATVNRAFSVAVAGECVLYSPAFSSFGKYFANEFDRGNQFMKLARARGTRG